MGWGRGVLDCGQAQRAGEEGGWRVPDRGDSMLPGSVGDTAESAGLQVMRSVERR